MNITQLKDNHNKDNNNKDNIIIIKNQRKF